MIETTNVFKQVFDEIQKKRCTQIAEMTPEKAAQILDGILDRHSQEDIVERVSLGELNNLSIIVDWLKQQHKGEQG